MRLRAALSLSAREATPLSAVYKRTADLKLEETLMCSIWSDETEMLAKLLSAIRLCLFNDKRDWLDHLPQRFRASAKATIPLAGEAQKNQTRSLSMMLDQLAKAMQ